ncbi:MAG: sialate O-acetylesterase [Planctomycetota bacterium]
MSLWHRAVVAFILFSLSIVCAGEADAGGYDLYLLIGQSNMAGRGKVDDESKKIHPQVFALNKAGSWVPAVDPLHFDKSAAGVGPGLAFGKAMADANPQSKIGLVPCAVGGSSISVWKPGANDAATKTHPYDDMLVRMKSALKHGKLKGILWHQGESDRSGEAAKHYAANLTELVARLRKEFDAPEVPFIAGEIGLLNEKNKDVTEQFNTVLHGLTKSISNYAVAPANGLKDKGDNLHFNSESARTLGQSYAKIMLEFAKRK